jgi:hypothetical protein
MAAMSCRRIARRFRDKTLSKPYVDSLKRVGDIPCLSPDTTDDRPEAARDDRDEFDSDRLFLQDFLSFYKEHPTELGTEIEHLLKKVESLTVPGDIELYTNDTRTEFHNLLLVLLYRFEQVLNRLAPNNTNSPPRGDSQPIKPSAIPPKPQSPPNSGDIQPLEPSAFKEAVEQLHLYGYGLLRLGRGRAFRLHLENIERSLDDPRRTSAGVSTDEYNQEHDNARDEEQEEDFDGVLPPQKLKSYVAWLRLIVGHFDAVEILARFVNSNFYPYHTISIDILVAPSTSPEKLDWRKLFTDGYVHNNTLFEFLKKGVLAVKDRNVREGKRKQAGENAEIEALREKLKQHPSATNFFCSLARNKPFTGALHCEAFLASLLPAFTERLSTLGDTKYKEIEILPDLKVKYLSCHLFPTSNPYFLFLR